MEQEKLRFKKMSESIASMENSLVNLTIENENKYSNAARPEPEPRARGASAKETNNKKRKNAEKSPSNKVGTFKSTSSEELNELNITLIL